MTDLVRLRDAVVAGAWVPAPLIGEKEPWPVKGSWLHFSRAYHGSVDAALAFVEAVLPKWTAVEIRSRRGKKRWVAALSRLTDETEECEIGHADTPARALLIAALNALIAQEATNG